MSHRMAFPLVLCTSTNLPTTVTVSPIWAAASEAWILTGAASSAKAGAAAARAIAKTTGERRITQIPHLAALHLHGVRAHCIGMQGKEWGLFVPHRRPALAEFLRAVGLGHGRRGNRHAQEPAQRVPTVCDLVDQKACRGDAATDLRIVALEGRDDVVVFTHAVVEQAADHLVEHLVEGFVCFGFVF